MSSTPVSKLVVAEPHVVTAPAALQVGSETALEAYAAIVREQLTLIGEDPSRDGLVKTPDRVARAMGFLTQGYAMTLDDAVGDALFEEEHENMVMVREFCFSTPRIIMHMWYASITTPTPRGWSTSSMAFATCSVSRSCTWSRRANMSTMRGSLERPTMRRCGM
jgi:hypothetical protein